MAGQRRLLSRGAAALLASVLAAAGFAGIGSTPASAQNPVTIDVTSGPNPVANGDQLTYTIVVTNTGGAKVTEVSLADQVTGLTGVDGTNALVTTSTVGSCGQDGNRILCNAGTLQGFQSWTVTIRGVVNVPNGTTLNNTASVTGTKSATTFTTSDTVTTQVGSGGGGGSLPDLVATIKGPVTALPSSDTLYTVTVDNVGTAKASDIALTVTLPSSVTYVTETSTNLFDCNLPTGSNTLTCTGGAINAGTNGTVQVAVTAPAFDTTVTVTTAVDPLNAIPEANELNNNNQATTQIGSQPAPNTLFLSKADNPDPVTPHDTLTYQLFLKNTSSYRADYIEVVDGTQGLDASNVAVTASVTGTSVPLTCTVAAPKVTCTTTRFQPGATAKITITGKVIQPPGSVILNTATVNGNIRNTGYTSTASTITVVRPSIDLTVTQHRTSPTPPAPVRAADRFDYTITVGNSGLYDANSVLVREPLPAGVFLDGFTASAGGTTCAADAAQVVTCVIPTVKGSESSSNDFGSTETIVLQLVAPQTLPSSPVSSAIGPITSTVTVDPNNTIPENEESNNDYTTTTDVLTGVDLTIAKKGTPDPVARNGELTYTITVTNDGTQDASQVVVRDPLPADVEFRAVRDTVAGPAGEQTTHRFTCSHTGGSKDPTRDRVLGGVVECRDGVIEGTYSGVGADLPIAEAVDFAVIEIDVFAPDEPGSYDNEVTVDPYGQIPEIDENDNFATETTAVENTNTGQGMYKELFVDNLQEVAEDPPAYATNGVLDYDLRVKNKGSATAFNTVVRFELPADSRFVSANDTLGAGEGSYTCVHSGGNVRDDLVYGGVVTCNGGTVGAGGTRAIRLRTFAPASPQTALLLAMVDPDNFVLEADETNNTAQETTVIQAGETTDVQGTYIDLKVKDILHTPDKVVPNGIVDYVVTIENKGTADAFGVKFQAALPTRFRYSTAGEMNEGDPASAFDCVHSGGAADEEGNVFGGLLTCTAARVNSGAARNVTVTMFAQSDTTTTSDDSTWPRLVVEVDPDNAIPEGHEGNNSAVETTQVRLDGQGAYTDLLVAKTADVLDDSDAGAVIPGGRIEYTLKVSNSGTNDAFNVKVRDPLPAGMTLVSAVADPDNTDPDDGFTCGQSGTTVECSGGYVKGSDSGGGERVIKIVARAPLVHDQMLFNSAFVDPDNAIPEANEGNNNSMVSNKVLSNLDLTVQMGDPSIGQNTDGEWSFTVTKSGNGEARDVVVEANFSPGGFVVNAQAPGTATPSGWSCRVSENDVNKVVCVGDITDNTAKTFTVLWHRSASTGGLDSYVDVDPTTGGYGGIVEIDENNNRDIGTNS
jgi:uncharacterized repeat protein (TIGR01451 family)